MIFSTPARTERKVLLRCVRKTVRTLFLDCAKHTQQVVYFGDARCEHAGGTQRSS
jgi:hypothetical protein